jgi:hypothetical protein
MVKTRKLAQGSCVRIVRLLHTTNVYVCSLFHFNSVAAGLPVPQDTGGGRRKKEQTSRRRYFIHSPKSDSSKPGIAQEC